MSLSSKLRRLLKEDRGVTAVLMALSLTTAIGLTAAATDLGMLYVAKAELQNAADATALAAADTMLGKDGNNNPIAQPYVALASAQQYSGANSVIGISPTLKNPAGSDFTIGYWDPATGAFDPNRTGMGLTDAQDVTAVKILLRRDDQANTPVGTYFAAIFGINSVNLTASSTAFVGYSNQVPVGAMPVPIAVWASKVSNGSGPFCGDVLTIGQNSGDYWTSFFDAPASTPAVDAYACGCKHSPLVKVGDSIQITNGNQSNNTFGDLQDQFNAHKVNGIWSVVLPVIADGYSHGAAPVVGFATFNVTAVHKAPAKDVVGTLACGVVVPNSPTGGPNYGARASASKMVR